MVWGEPLLALDIIERINSFILLQKLKNENLIFISEITTNGFLLNIDIAKKLTDLNIKTYQISLDGPEYFHNRTRVKINGSETFKKIWYNLKELHKSRLDYNVTIRLHVTHENFKSCLSFIETLKSEFLFDSRFHLFIKAIGRYGGAYDEKINPTNIIYEESLKSIFENTQTTGIIKETNICYASKPNSFVIRADGKINKCTVGLNNPINFVGHLLENRDLSIKPELAMKWSKGFFLNDLDYLACPLSKLQ